MKKVVFIAGADHSGSTLLGCILGANIHPFEYFHVGEVHAYFRKEHKKYGFPGDAGKTKYGNIWYNIDKSVGYEKAYPEINDKSGTIFIIDSSKLPHHFEVAYSSCHKNQYALDTIVSFRPFTKIFKSDLNRQKPLKNIMNNIKRYKIFYDKFKKYDINLNYTIVNIEQLILNPREMTECICEKVGIPYFEGKENYWNYPSCHLYGARTQRQHLKSPNDAKYDIEKVLTTPSVHHPFLEREDVREVEEFLIKNSLTF